jgi:hypothetical protein
MITQANFKDLLELDTETKWDYLRRYYEAAMKFYDYQEEAVSEAEIEAAIKAFKVKPAPLHRKRIPLVEWKYCNDPEDIGIEQGYFADGLDDSRWEAVTVPHSTRNIPEKPLRYGKSMYPFMQKASEDIWCANTDNWYRCQVAQTEVQENEVAYLRFGSNNLLTDIWVNENPVMIQHLGLFPFETEVTEELGTATSEKSSLAVRVRNIVTNRPWLFYNGFQLSYYMPPYTSGELGDDWNDQPWTGIAGEAVLDVLNRVHIQDVFVVTEEIVDQRAALSCQVTLRNEAWQRFRGKVRVSLSPWLPEEGKTIHECEAAVELLPMKPKRIDLRFSLENPALWSPDHPSLYLAHVILEDENGKPMDDFYETCGVRTFRMVGNNYYLNNEKFYPMGTHDVCHYHNESEICPSDHAIVKDILLHKKMGANCSRYPSDLRIHYKRIAEYCDQLGFMLSWAGFFEVWLSHPEMEMYASRDVKTTVCDLRNCPSVAIWEMGDEPLMYIKHYRRFQWYEKVYELVYSEDQSRPILPAGHFSAEILHLYEKKKEAGMDPDEIRKQIIADYPIYSLELTYWDIHNTIMHFPLRPFREYMERVKEAFDGKRLSILTEFGFDALPDPDKVRDVYGGFRWGANPLWFRDRKTDDLAYYGKVLLQEDWRETQAAQAYALSSTVTYIRENPSDFAGFYFMTMFDIWTYMQGITDEKGQPKLGYFVARSFCQPILVSGLHGSVEHPAGRNIEITASNVDKTLSECRLTAQLVNAVDQVVFEDQFKSLEVAGNVQVSRLVELNTNPLKKGLYRLELNLLDRDGTELARSMEMFYLK